MIVTGVLTENDRCELIRGELIEKMTIGDPHMAGVRRLIKLFSVLGDQAITSAQDAIKLLDSRPEPDVALLVPRSDFYASQTPGPPDILLLVEVADSSLAYDRQVKLPLYAENSIREYWIVNLIDDCLEVHRQPRAADYSERLVVRRGDRISPLAFPALSLAAEMLLGELPAG
jgi:Uma2 family endonuclease